MAAGAQTIEDFHFEVTASAWLTDPSGTIQSGISPVDLRNDLNLERWNLQFFGNLVVKPGKRHRLWIEGTPYRLTGVNEVTRQFTFAGRTYTFRDRVSSTAEIDYVAGGYQFDFVSRAGGHFGIQAGVGYVDATGRLVSQSAGFNGTETQAFPFPLTGLEGRLQVLPHTSILSVSGCVKGMSFASYGHFVQANVEAGVGLGRHVILLAGYRFVDADVHRRDETRGFQPRFGGPLVSVQFRR